MKTKGNYKGLCRLFTEAHSDLIIYRCSNRLNSGLRSDSRCLFDSGPDPLSLSADLVIVTSRHQACPRALPHALRQSGSRN
jgi:hypothetical protein